MKNSKVLWCLALRRARQPTYMNCSMHSCILATTCKSNSRLSASLDKWRVIIQKHLKTASRSYSKLKLCKCSQASIESARHLDSRVTCSYGRGAIMSKFRSGNGGGGVNRNFSVNPRVQVPFGMAMTRFRKTLVNNSAHGYFNDTTTMTRDYR